MLYVSILQSLAVHLHCAGVCLHPVRVHACNALPNDFSPWLSLLSSGFEFHFAELSFISLRFFFPPKACYTEGGKLANSLCSLGDSLEFWLLSVSDTVVYKTLTCVQWHLLFTLIEYLSQNLLGSEAEGMFKNADAEEGQSNSLVLRKAKCWSQPQQGKERKEYEERGGELPKARFFLCCASKTKGTAWKASLRISERDPLPFSGGCHSRWNTSAPHAEQPEPQPSAWQPHIAPVQRCMPAKSSTGMAAHTPLWQRDTGCSALLSLLERGGSNLFQRNYCTGWEPDSRETSYKPQVAVSFFSHHWQHWAADCKCCPHQQITLCLDPGSGFTLA